MSGLNTHCKTCWKHRSKQLSPFVRYVIPATLVATGITVLLVAAIVVALTLSSVAPYVDKYAALAQTLPAVETASSKDQTRGLQQVSAPPEQHYDTPFFSLNSPPFQSCSLSTPVLCVWYPVSVKWYKVIAYLPRFLIYNFDLSNYQYSNANWIIPPKLTDAFINPLRPWDYVQSLALMIVPALGMAVGALLMGILFYLACSITCGCNCCCFQRLFPNKRRSFMVKLVAKILMLLVAAAVCFGLFLEFSGYTLWRNAVTSFMNIVVSEVTRMKDLAVNVAKSTGDLASNFTSGSPPGAVDTVENMGNLAVQYSELAREYVLCSDQIPILIRDNWSTFDYNTYYTVALNDFIIKYFGCPDLLFAIFLIMVHSIAAVSVALGILAVVIQKKFPALLMAWLSFICCALALIVFMCFFPISVFLSDVCTQIDLLENNQGTDPILNQYNVPNYIVTCGIQKLIQPIFDFVDASISLAQQGMDDENVIITDYESGGSTYTTSEYNAAKDAFALAKATLDTLKKILGYLQDFLSCEHAKSLYYSLKALLCNTVLSSISSMWNGAMVMALSFIPGFLIGMVCFVLLRPNPPKTAEEMEADAADEDGGDDEGMIEDDDEADEDDIEEGHRHHKRRNKKKKIEVLDEEEME